MKSRSSPLGDSIRDAWSTNDRITTFLVEQLPAAVWDAAIVLNKAGHLGRDRALPVGADLARAYRTAGEIYKSGDVMTGRDLLAMNFLLDRDAAGWARDLATLKAQVGDCETSDLLTASGELTGDFTWRCSHGRVKGSLELAPTHPPRIQALELKPVQP